MEKDKNRLSEFVGQLNQVKDVLLACCVGGILMTSIPEVNYADCTIAEVDDPGFFGSLGYTVDAVGDANGDGHDDFVATVLFGSGGVYSGNDGTLLLPISSLTAAGAGDVNQDGFDDILLGTSAFGSVVVSGSDGSVLLQLSTIHDPTAVDGLGDVNGDGYPDQILAYAHLDQANVHSGKDGTILFTFAGSAGTEFGGSVGAAGDVNADGFPDILIGERAPFVSSVVRVYSGLDASLIHEFAFDPMKSFGFAIDGVGDLNGDGHDDVIVGSEQGDGAKMYSYPSPGFDQAGFSVSGAHDLDGDGRPDFMIGSAGARVTTVYSGATGVALLQYSNGGHAAAGIGDANGDGFSDLVISNQSTGVDVSVISGATLRAGNAELSLSSGGTQTLSVCFGKLRAGHGYWVLGSGVGTTPGIDITSNLNLPLNPDSYFSLLSKNPFATPFQSFISVLDSDGCAEPSITIPPGSDPAFAGTVLHHALIVATVLFGAIDGTSNAVSLTLIP